MTRTREVPKWNPVIIVVIAFGPFQSPLVYNDCTYSCPARTSGGIETLVRRRRSKRISAVLLHYIIIISRDTCRQHLTIILYGRTDRPTHTKIQETCKLKRIFSSRHVAHPSRKSDVLDSERIFVLSVNTFSRRKRGRIEKSPCLSHFGFSWLD